MTTVEPIPSAYPGATPYLHIRDAAAALLFYQQAFGAVETVRLSAPNGKVAHAEITIGKAVVMLGDELPEMQVVSPTLLGGSSVTVVIYVADVDAFVNQAVTAGAKLVRPIQDQFYGDRSGKLLDPFGHNWIISTHIEDVSPAEMVRRFEEMFAK